ncbi:MAG TPA: 5-carboxymethyl-2-hydroxymuconate Delta-isomerase [Bacteroidia bacterium]|jgi:5-carboxymethyl-2-hydroxymuconate isomerase
MPHFIIDCSENVLKHQEPGSIIQCIFDEANATRLFKKGDIKVRMIPFRHFTVGGTQKDFIHIHAHIMGGRSTEKKNDLARRIITKLKEMFPYVPVISIDVRDIDPQTYCNKTMV